MILQSLRSRSKTDPDDAPARTGAGFPSIFSVFFVAWLSVACVRPPAVLDLPEPTALGDRLTVTLQREPDDTLTVEVLAEGSGAAELEIGLYAVALGEDGRVAVNGAEVRRIRRPGAHAERAVRIPLPLSERIRLSIDPVDPVSGYPDPDWTYLPQRVPEASLRDEDAVWRAVWELRARGNGLWLRHDSSDDRLEAWLDVSRIERFLHY